jgi:CBS-domain-containing membrane protein
LLEYISGLSGIITDNDITRKVLATGVDAREISASEVMTKQPLCVYSDDSALDALDLMVRHQFRHLPVLSRPREGEGEGKGKEDQGSVVGLLDVAKCLYDAISALEKVQEKDRVDGGRNQPSNASDTCGIAEKTRGLLLCYI